MNQKYVIKVILTDGTYLWFGYDQGKRAFFKDLDDPRIHKADSIENAQFIVPRVWELHGLEVGLFDKVEVCAVGIYAYPVHSSVYYHKHH